VVIIEVTVPKAWLKRHGGAADGFWRCVRDIPVTRFLRVIGFEQLTSLPVGRRAMARDGEETSEPPVAHSWLSFASTCSA
jgi:hypothetical protein